MLALYEVSKDPGELDYLIFQVDKLYRIIKSLEQYSDEIVHDLSQILSILLQCQNDEHRGSDICSMQASRVLHIGSTGRPRLDISEQQLEYLLRIGFSCPQIASVIGVSSSAIRRQMTECGLSVRKLYSSISDHYLDMLVRNIQHHFPNSGYRMMYAHLLQEGHQVPHHRVRETL